MTLIEVLMGVLILLLGLTSACGLILYGVRLTRSANAKLIGNATACTVLADASPLQAANPLWTQSNGVTKGYLNGLWVERSESNSESIGGGITMVTVTVDVFYVQGSSRPLASATGKMIKP